MEKGAVFFAKHNETYVLKLVGEIRYKLGCSFDNFLKKLFTQNDFNDIILDLTETRMIDSTCLGLLVKVANFNRTRNGRKTTIFSTNEDINKILDSVGFYTVFNIYSEYPSKPLSIEMMAMSDSDRAHLARTVYDAHCILSELNEKNRAVFKSVIDALQEKVDVV